MEGAAGAAGLLVFEFFLGGEVGGVVLGVVLIEAAEVLELLHAEGFFYHGDAGGEVVEHVAFPEAEDGPAHGGEALGVATVAEDVAFYLGVPVGTVALDALLGMVPVAAMPEVAIDEDGDLAALEADVGRAREPAHVLAVAVATMPQLTRQQPLRTGALATVGLHTATTLFGCEMVGHGSS